MKGDLPGKRMVWRIVQDFKAKNLYFLATEFGLYFSLDGGKQWIQFKGGLPSISFRDLVIQKRENDLVVASFGRGFFVLDDYSALRELSNENLEKEAILFQSRKAWWYLEKRPLGWGKKGIQGASLYAADNPPFGTTFTYYLKETFKSKESIRKKEEKKLNKSNSDVPFPGWDALEEERLEVGPKIWIIIKDSDGEVMMKLPGENGKGLHRTTWDFSYAHADAIPLNTKPYGKKVPSVFKCAPGMYSATIFKQLNAEYTQLTDPMEFEVETLYKSSIKEVDMAEVATFWREMEALDIYMTATTRSISFGLNRVVAMQNALAVSSVGFGDLYGQLEVIRLKFNELDAKLGGNKSKHEVGANEVMNIWDRFETARSGVDWSMYGPTPMHLENMAIAESEHAELRLEVEDLLNIKIPAMEKALEDAGAPWIQGMDLPERK
jgi:hypothetical protein